MPSKVRKLEHAVTKLPTIPKELVERFLPGRRPQARRRRRPAARLRALRPPPGRKPIAAPTPRSVTATTTRGHPYVAQQGDILMLG